jgi:hypothetical protein
MTPSRGPMLPMYQENCHWPFVALMKSWNCGLLRFALVVTQPRASTTRHVRHRGGPEEQGQAA